MSTSSILVLLTMPDAATLDVAADAARALGTPTIEVLHVRIDPISTIMPSEEVLTPARVNAVEAASLAEGTSTYAAFTAWQEAGHQGHWTELVGEPAHEVQHHARDAALVVLTLPAPHAPPSQRAALEAAVFAAGRPVLAVPPGWHGGFGRHLAVGWCDTPTTCRALTALRPWLSTAETLSVLTVGEAAALRPDGPLAGLPGHIEQRSIAPTHGDGAALLAAAAESGADGLAIGAYRRGRILEWVLGGVTEYALHHATLPLLLVH